MISQLLPKINLHMIFYATPWNLNAHASIMQNELIAHFNLWMLLKLEIRYLTFWDIFEKCLRTMAGIILYQHLFPRIHPMILSNFLIKLLLSLQMKEHLGTRGVLDIGQPSWTYLAYDDHTTWYFFSVVKLSQLSSSPEDVFWNSHDMLCLNVLRKVEVPPSG